MSEISPIQIPIVAAQEQKDADPLPDLFAPTLDVLRIIQHEVKIPKAKRNARYPHKKWVASVARDVCIDGEYVTCQLAYPVKRGRQPEEVHIIVNGEFGYPWATTQAHEWVQLIGSTTDDGALSTEGQITANSIVSNIASYAQQLKDERKKLRVNRVKILGTVSALAAIVAGGVHWNMDRMERNAEIAAQEAEALQRFDAFWATRKLTPTPIVPNGELQAATEDSIPSGAPLIEIKKDDKGVKTLSEPLREGIVRRVNLENDASGCITLSTEIGQTATISVLTVPTNDYVGAVANDRDNTLKLCVLKINEANKSHTTIAVQLTPSSLTDPS